MEPVSDLVVLANKYGFAVLFSCLATPLIFWVVRKLVSHLIESSRKKDTLITNHIAHLTEAVVRGNEKIDGFRVDLSEGFDRLASVFEKGLDRQTEVFDKVLSRTCPIIKEDEHGKQNEQTT